MIFDPPVEGAFDNTSFAAIIVSVGNLDLKIEPMF